MLELHGEGLPCLRSECKTPESANPCNGSEDRPLRTRIRFPHLNQAEVNNFVRGLIADALIGKSYDCQAEEDHAGDFQEMHKCLSFAHAGHVLSLNVSRRPRCTDQKAIRHPVA